MTHLSLTERQRDLIARAHAADGRIEPFLDIKGGAKIKMIEALAKRGLIEPVAGQWRITQAAVALVVTGEAQPHDVLPPTQPADDAKPQAAAQAGWQQDQPDAARKRSRSHSKQARVIEMLKRPEGATIAQISEATGWQAHSLRALLCHTLPRKGIRILAERQDGMRRKVYRLAEA